MVYDKVTETERDEVEASRYVSHHIRFKPITKVMGGAGGTVSGDFRHYRLADGPHRAVCVELVYLTRHSKRPSVGGVVSAWERESSDLTYQEWVALTHRQAKFVLLCGTGFTLN